MNSFLRRIPPWFVDLALAIALAVASLIDLATIPDEVEELAANPADGVTVVLILLGTLPLAFRRLYPATVLTVIALAWSVDRFRDYPSTLAVFALLFAFHAVGSELPRRRAQLVGWSWIVILVGFTLSGYLTGVVALGTVLIMAVFTVFPFMLGLEIHERRRQQQELEVKTRQLEAEREVRARDAVRTERQRIARELHDVVAHQMSVSTIQTAAARRAVRTDPDRAIEALVVAEQAGHDGLTEMRRLLGVLRTDDGAERGPQPGLDRLPVLVEQIRDAGVPTELVIEGEPRQLPAGVDLNAFRIIQESLTNTLRHGGPDATARVHVAYRSTALEIEVTDTGRGVAAVGTEGPGHGLIGMRERAALLDGTLDARPMSAGGFRVDAVLPLPTS